VYGALKNITMNEDGADKPCGGVLSNPYACGLLTLVGCGLTYTGVFSSCIPGFGSIECLPMLSNLGELAVIIPSAIVGALWKEFRDHKNGKEPSVFEYTTVLLNGLICTPCLLFETYQQSALYSNFVQQRPPPNNPMSIWKI